MSDIKPDPLDWGFVPSPGVPCFGSKFGGFVWDEIRKWLEISGLLKTCLDKSGGILGLAAWGMGQMSVGPWDLGNDWPLLARRLSLIGEAIASAFFCHALEFYWQPFTGSRTEKPGLSGILCQLAGEELRVVSHESRVSGFLTTRNSRLATSCLICSFFC